MPGRLLAALLLSVLVCVPGLAADIPDALKPWEGWVLHIREEKVCPPAFKNGSDHRCCWPAKLALNPGAGGHPFEAKNPRPMPIAASAATIHIATQSCSLAKIAMTATTHREIPPRMLAMPTTGLRLISVISIPSRSGSSARWSSSRNS